MSVVIIGSPKFPVLPPDEARYAASDRVIYWQAMALSNFGISTTVIATSDSRLPPGVTADLWNEPSLEGGRRAATFDPEAARLRHAEHVLRSLLEHESDTIVFHSPRISLIDRLTDRQRLRTIVIAHNPGFDSVELDAWISEHPEVRLAVLTKKHRQSYQLSGGRAEIIRSGIPVRSFPFDPAATVASGGHKSLAVLDAVGRAGRRVVSQVDRISPDKAQHVSLHIFKASRAASMGWDLILAGPRANPEYMQELTHMVELDPHLRGRVHFVPSLTGSEVQQLYGASDAVLAPAGMRLDGDSRERRGSAYIEAFGLGPAIAQAVGTPIIASAAALDGSMLEHGVSGWWMNDAEEGAQHLSAALRHSSRQNVRNWAVENLDMTSGMVALIDHIVPTSDAGNSEATALVDRAVAQITNGGDLTDDGAAFVN